MELICKRVGNHPGIPFHLLGSLEIATATIFFLLHQENLLVATFEAILPSLVAVPLFYAGLRLEREGVEWKTSLRIFGVTIGTGLLVLATAVVVVFVVFLRGHRIPNVNEIYLMALAGGFAIGSPLGFYYLQLRERNRELQEQYEELRNLNRRFSVARRIIRHNLRNELAITMGLTESLMEDADEDELPVLEKIYDHQERLVDLAATANDIRRAWETDDVVEQDLAALAREEVEPLRRRAPGIKVQTALPDETPVRAHPMIRKGISEVLDNSVKHNVGEVDLFVGIRERDAPEGYVRLEITDTGCGIPPEEIHALESPEEKPLVHGTGLGLQLLHAVVTQSDGKMTFEENEPTGAIIRIDLPKARPTPDRYGT